MQVNEGDEVAIVPSPDSPPEEAIEIAVVRRVGVILIELSGDRMYTVSDGKALAPQPENYIVRETDEHRLFAGRRKAGNTNPKPKYADGPGLSSTARS